MPVKLLSAPERIFLALTSRCNLHCRHCNVYPFRESAGDFSTDEWRAFARRLSELKVLSLWLSGGEVFCREDLFEVLEAFHEQPLHLDGLNTNATLVDRGAALRLASLPKLGMVQVGLDGADERSHDRLRGRGVFARASRGIEHLVAAGLRVSLFCVVTRFNHRELEAVVRRALDWGVRAVTLAMLLPQGNALHHTDEMALSPGEWRQAVREAGRLARAYPSVVGGSLVDMYRMFSAFEAGPAPPPGLPEPCLTGCKTGVTECTVMSDGRVLPCDRLQDVVAGNLREQDLADIWLRSPVFEDFRRRFTVRLRDLPGCGDCPYRFQCTGGCPAVPFYTEGTLLARDPYSCYRHFRGEDA